MKKLTVFAVLFGLVCLLAPGVSFGQSSEVFNFTLTPGNQTWGGNLATPFTVNSPVSVNDLGIYNAIGGIKMPAGSGPIQVGLYDITTSSQVGPIVTFLSTGTYTASGYSLTQQIGAVTLLPGSYEVDAVGFNGNDLNGNTGINPLGAVWTFNNDGGALSFAGSIAGQSGSNSIYNNSSILNFPTFITGTPDAHNYAAGTFSVPEGGASLLYLLLAGGACFGAMFLVPRNRFANLASA